MIKEIFKRENGSMAVYTSVVLLTMLIIITAIFITSNMARATQLQTAIKVKESYQKDNSKAGEIYAKLTENTSTPSYVTNGLILHYDAINNTGNGHDNNATVWKDLSGNENDLTLSNLGNDSTSGWGDNTLNFDGIDDFGTVTTIQNILSGETTISTRIYSEQYNNYRGIYGNHYGPYGSVVGILNQFQNEMLRIGYNSNIVDLSYTDVCNKYITLTVQMGASVGTKVYINGNLIKESKNETTNPNVNGANFWIGKSNDSADRYFSGKMNNFMIYNRILTDSEISQNYRADEARF